MKALVLGARGAVGAVVAEALRAWGHEALPAGRRPPPGGVALDLRGEGGMRKLRAAAAEADVVVNCSGVEDPALTEAAAPAALVEVSATGRYLGALREAAPPGASVVLGAGLAPGLSTVLAADLPARPGDEVDVAVMLGSGERHGAAAVAWTSGLAGARIGQPPEDPPVRNFRAPRRFTGPDGRRRRYLRADFPDHVLLGAPSGITVRSYLALTSGASTWALGLVGHLPALAPAMDRAPHLGGEQWSLTVTRRGTGERRTAHGVGQSRATGVLTALAAAAVVASPPGRPVTMADALPWAEVAALPEVDLGGRP